MCKGQISCVVDDEHGIGVRVEGYYIINDCFHCAGLCVKHKALSPVPEKNPVIRQFPDPEQAAFIAFQVINILFINRQKIIDFFPGDPEIGLKAISFNREEMFFQESEALNVSVFIRDFL